MDISTETVDLIISGGVLAIFTYWLNSVQNKGKSQQDRIDSLEKTISTLSSQVSNQNGELKGHIDVLEAVKMDESKTRQIVADSLEPLKQGQEELKGDVKNLITGISNLSVQIAKAGLMRHEDAE